MLGVLTGADGLARWFYRMKRGVPWRNYGFWFELLARGPLLLASPTHEKKGPPALFYLCLKWVCGKEATASSDKLQT